MSPDTPSLTTLQQDMERRLVHQALKANMGNVSAAARELHVSRQLLRYKMRKHGLVRADYLGVREMLNDEC